MHVRQVRTKNNRFNTVQYDSAGNILTPSRKRELKKLAKKHPKGGPKWVKIISQYSGTCCVCHNNMLIGKEMLWNKKNKKTKHIGCEK